MQKEDTCQHDSCSLVQSCLGNDWLVLPQNMCVDCARGMQHQSLSILDRSNKHQGQHPWLWLRNYLLDQNQQLRYSCNIYKKICNVTQFILSGNCSICFGWYHYPSSGAHTTVSTASDICHTVIATCRYSGR